MTKVNPTRIYRGLSLTMVCKLISTEKPKVVTTAYHLNENGFTGSLMPTDFFALPVSF